MNLEAARSSAEEARAAAAGHPLEHSEELFDRSTQHAGLLVGTIVTGVALSVLFAGASTLTRNARPVDAVWGRCLRFGGAAWLGAYVVAFIRYPANQPGVGDPGTRRLRTSAYRAALGIGVVGVLVAGRVVADLRRWAAAASTRQLAVAGTLVATVALTYALPSNPGAFDAPAGLLWEFRLFAFATTSLMSAGLTVIFGLLEQRAEAHPSLPTNQPVSTTA